MAEIIKVSDLLTQNEIIDIQATSKKEALEEMLAVICKSEKITKPKAFVKGIFDREKMMSTGIGYEIAIPHVRLKSVKDFVMAVGRSKQGIEYASIDDKPVKLIFMIGASEGQDKAYIALLSRLMLRLKNPEFMDKMMHAATPGEMYEIIKETR
ncbi:MAG: PTS sugar transporter subunit IIA [Candidatus Cloacimonetes bacterium]|nr:PTS sugar transporter subunit IIA [Candidatus Cloacimonadota bacterium]